MIGASFDSTKTPLHDLLGRADSGKLQLPDFQRSWVWEDGFYRSILTEAVFLRFFCYFFLQILVNAMNRD